MAGLFDEGTAAGTGDRLKMSAFAVDMCCAASCCSDETPSLAHTVDTVRFGGTTADCCMAEVTDRSNFGTVVTAGK